MFESGLYPFSNNMFLSLLYVLASQCFFLKRNDASQTLYKFVFLIKFLIIIFIIFKCLKFERALFSSYILNIVRMINNFDKTHKIYWIINKNLHYIQNKTHTLLYGLKTEMRYTKELLYYGVVPKYSDNLL